jgi:hypothetical protein
MPGLNSAVELQLPAGKSLSSAGWVHLRVATTPSPVPESLRAGSRVAGFTRRASL